MTVQTTPASTTGTSAMMQTSDARVAVAIPMPNDPDWKLFDAIPTDVPILVIDDSDGHLQPPPRDNVQFYDYAAQEAVMGSNYAAIPHKSAATRNFAHYLALKEGFEVVVALDYDCRTRPGWLETHLACLGTVVDAPALAGAWINSIEAPGFFARGYPYEYRNAAASHVTETRASGEVKVNMGVWENVLDLNGIDKLQAEAPTEPGLRGERNYVALGNIPVCGMNTAFTADLIPAYFFLPDVWVDGTWQLSRHDDIWGGYILKRLMDIRGDLFSYGRPVVEHTRQSTIERVVVIEHYMHLMSMQFYAIVEQAVQRVNAADYATMFADFTEEYRKEAARAAVPAHFRQAFCELGEAMDRWVRCFS
jgi:hypothetical protein